MANERHSAAEATLSLGHQNLHQFVGQPTGDLVLKIYWRILGLPSNQPIKTDVEEGWRAAGQSDWRDRIFLDLDVVRRDESHEGGTEIHYLRGEDLDRIGGESKERQRGEGGDGGWDSREEIVREVEGPQESHVRDFVGEVADLVRVEKKRV